MSDQKTVKIALVGNPNCGKSTLFNRLTGLNQRTGNFPGVTVDKHSGVFSNEGIDYDLVDLPGTYSLYPKTEDETVCFDAVFQTGDETLDKIIYVADATNLKRSLYLLSQLINCNVSIVVALNLSDQLSQRGEELDNKVLEKEFGLPFISISAAKNTGIDELKLALKNASKGTFNFNNEDLFSKEAFPSYASWLLSKPNSKQDDLQIRTKLSNEIITRYKSITQVCNSAIKKSDLKSVHRADDILTHPVWGYLIFAAILFVVFQSIFSLSSYPMDWIENVFGKASSYLGEALPESVFSRLLVEGIIPGLGGIVVFVPQIAFLFAFIAIMEDSGYMARVSLLSDRILKVFGLNGKSILSLLSGVACAVPAIMGTRTISNWKERIITILITPLMSCSARLPVYTFIITLTIPAYYVGGFLNIQGLILLSFYLLGFIVALLVALIAKRFIPETQKSYFIMELPAYRKPRIETVFKVMWTKVKVFLLDAGKIILAISIVLWFRSSYGPGERMEAIDKQYNEQIGKLGESEILSAEYNSKRLENSYAGIIGKSIEPAIKPLGYDWKIGIALFTSFAAREVFVGTLATIYSVGNQDDTEQLLVKVAREKKEGTSEPLFNLATGISLMLFYLFAMQCMSTVSVVYRETQSIKWPLIQFIMMTVLAYVSALVAYNVLE